MAASYLAAVVRVELVEEGAQGHRVVLAAGELRELLRKVRVTVKVEASQGKGGGGEGEGGGQGYGQGWGRVEVAPS